MFAAKLPNVFFVQPAPVARMRRSVRELGPLAPGDQRPKTAAYVSLDDPFASPIADAMQATVRGGRDQDRLQARSIRPRPRTSPRSSPRRPRRTPTCGSAARSPTTRTAQVKSMISLNFSPKFLYLSNGANSPVEFPSKVGADNVQRDLQLWRLVPELERQREQGLHRRLHQAVRRQRLRDRLDVRRGLRRRSAHPAGRREDRIDRQQDDHRHAAQRHVADRRGQPQLGPVRDRRRAPTCSWSGSTRSWCRSTLRKRGPAGARRTRSRTGAANRAPARPAKRRRACACSCRPSSSGCSPVVCTP